ncbi:MAG TPA: hypothetical protein VF783_13930 [Terriglobales bacterium]
MTPEQKVKHLILLRHAELTKTPILIQVTADNIDELYDETNGDDYELQDAESQVRCSGIETNLPCDWSRHYESDAVAAQAPDGSWVGWTYWYGGGKHGEPEAIDWMDSAYDVDVTEEEKLVVVRTFKKAA